MMKKKDAVVNDEEENDDKEKAEAEDQLEFEAGDCLVWRLIHGVMNVERNVAMIYGKDLLICFVCLNILTDYGFTAIAGASCSLCEPQQALTWTLMGSWEFKLMRPLTQACSPGWVPMLTRKKPWRIPEKLAGRWVRRGSWLSLEGNFMHSIISVMRGARWVP